MPRRLRNWVDNSTYHLTHRCEDKNFYFKFSKYRKLYCHYLHAGQKRYKVDVLNFIVTSNHVHLILTAKCGQNISRCIQYVHSHVAQEYNRLKQVDRSFWHGRFHATLIENGEHLGRCLFYIDMNMVRAGQVEHPSEWEHSGYHEIMKDKDRYRIVNVQRLMECLKLGNAGKEELRNWYRKTLDEKLSLNFLQREAFWSEAYAVGSNEWLNETAEKTGLKKYDFYKTDKTEYIKGRIYSKNS